VQRVESQEHYFTVEPCAGRPWEPVHKIHAVPPPATLPGHVRLLVPSARRISEHVVFVPEADVRGYLNRYPLARVGLQGRQTQ